jgi:hypothetical protein
MTTAQKVFVAAVIAAAVGAGIYEARQASIAQDRIKQLEQQRAEDAKKWEQQRAQEQTTMASLTEENARLKSGQNSSELLKLRSQVGKLRQQTAAGGNSSNGLANYLNDPTSKELRRVEAEQALRAKYATLCHQLNLSPEAADKFIKLLVDSEMNKKDMLAQAVAEHWDSQAALQNRDAERANLQSQMTSLVGESGYAQFNQFRRETDAGALVNSFNDELGDNALNTSQSKQMVDLYTAQPEAAFDMMDLFRSPDSLNAAFQAAIQDRGDDALQKAASFLSPQQLAAYGSAQSNYVNSLRMQMNLTRQIVVGAAGK